MRTGAVIVAAGMSSRMGDFKPMLKIGAISMVQRVIMSYQQAGVFPIVLVTGYRGDELKKHVAGTGVICVHNDAYATTQMLDSARIGFSYIADKCDRTFFSPVDVPLFTINTVVKLMRADASVVKPAYRGRNGHPILLKACVLPQLLSEEAEGGLRRVIDACCGGDIAAVEVDDEGILLDADTPEDFSRLVERHNRQLLRPDIEISLMRENKLLDKGGALLLQMIVYTGTVKGACEKLQISYSKAWGMLDEMEKNLGFPLIERRPGGEYGGSSQLTAEGRSLLERYEAFAEKVRKYADACFSACFGNYI
jgi:molybdenum cofactor cytidylyltransferase